MKALLFQFVIIVLIVACTDSAGDNSSLQPPPSADELKSRWDTVKNAISLIREGDLVLRCGNDQSSESLRDFNQKDGVFSHCGIALMTDSGLYVYHNMAGEMNPDEIMRRDPVDSFLNPAINTAIGICRYSISDSELIKLKNIVYRYYDEKLQFDMNFDMETDDRMYCAEMIAKSIKEATDNRIIFSMSTVNNRLKTKYLKMALEKGVIPSKKTADNLSYLSIDDLYVNLECHEVYKKIFQDIDKPVAFPTPESYKQ